MCVSAFIIIIIIQMGATEGINCQQLEKPLLVKLDQQMDYPHHHTSHASILNLMWCDGRDLKLVLFEHN